MRLLDKATAWWDSVRFWQSKRRIRKLKLGLEIGRRHFLQGLLLAPFTPVPPTPEAIREAIVAEYLSTARGRAMLAASMIHPLRRRMDYAGIARKAFQVQEMPPGTAPFYPRDP